MTPATRQIVNVAAWLPIRADEQPDKPAIIWRSGRGADGRAVYSHLSFRELNEDCDACAYGLREAGIERGTRTILMVRPSPSFFSLTFALYKLGAVPVLIDPGMGRKNMVECLREVDAAAFIGIPLAHVLRVLHRSAFRGIRTVITDGRRWLWGGRRLADIRERGRRIAEQCVTAFPMADTMPDDPAAIIFTTGSTGPPKGVLYLHGMFDAQVRILRERFDIQPDEIDLPTFPLFALFDPALGMSAVIPEMDFTRPAHVDPERIIEAVRDNAVTHMFGSPALLDRVGRFGEANGVVLPSLRRVISAGAPVPAETLRRFGAMLRRDDGAVSPRPHDGPSDTGDLPVPQRSAPQIFTPYGATEALPVAVIGSDEILGETAALTARGLGTCVGRPAPGVTVRIIRITDDPIDIWTNELELPRGEVGEIAVHGPVVTREYITSEAATRLAKIPDGRGGVWHRMGDLGRMDEHGRIWFYGRKAHRVITERGILFTEPVEAVFNQHPKLRRSALVGVGERGRQKPVVCIEVDQNALEERDHENPNALGEELFAIGAQHDFTKNIDTFLIHPGFPVDIRHNSKIFREKLAVWAEKQMGLSKPQRPKGLRS